MPVEFNQTSTKHAPGVYWCMACDRQWGFPHISPYDHRAKYYAVMEMRCPNCGRRMVK